MEYTYIYTCKNLDVYVYIKQKNAISSALAWIVLCVENVKKRITGTLV